MLSSWWPIVSAYYGSGATYFVLISQWEWNCLFHNSHFMAPARHSRLRMYQASFQRQISTTQSWIMANTKRVRGSRRAGNANHVKLPDEINKNVARVTLMPCAARLKRVAFLTVRHQPGDKQEILLMRVASAWRHISSHFALQSRRAIAHNGKWYWRRGTDAMLDKWLRRRSNNGTHGNELSMYYSWPLQQM